MSARDVLDTLRGELCTGLPYDWADLSADEQAQLALASQQFVSRAQVWAGMITAEADARNAIMRSTGTPTASFLAQETNVSRSQAAGWLWRGKDLRTRTIARDAALGGMITAEHTRAVIKAMKQMPGSFTPAQEKQAEALLVKIALDHTPEEVVQAAFKVAEEVDPSIANQSEQDRLETEREIAWRNRFLTWRTKNGSVVFKGSLPLVEGAAFTATIEAYANKARRNQGGSDATQAGDADGEQPNLLQRRADGLAQMVQDVQTNGAAPNMGGQRPGVVVSLDYNKLKDEAADAGVLPDGEPLSAGDLRRTCCDANIIPIVLGSESEPLDIGKAERVVPDGLRQALISRDKHCAFPRCDIPGSRCEAHHMTPWWQGGPTNLTNLVLLCPAHHGLVEPGTRNQRDQWRVTMGKNGRPVFTPPARFQDYTRRHRDADPAKGATVRPSPPEDPYFPNDTVVNRQ